MFEHGRRAGTLDWLADALEDRRSRDLHRILRPRRATDHVLDLASNDYLGLVKHPAVLHAAFDAVRTFGAGSTGSRLITGTTVLHDQLEDGLAQSVGAESALVFSSGYMANLAVVTALSGRDAVILSDSASHASLIDACRLSRARIEIFDRTDRPAPGDASWVTPNRLFARRRRRSLGVYMSGASARRPYPRERLGCV